MRCGWRVVVGWPHARWPETGRRWGSSQGCSRSAWPLTAFIQAKRGGGEKEGIRLEAGGELWCKPAAGEEAPQDCVAGWQPAPACMNEWMVGEGAGREESGGRVGNLGAPASRRHVRVPNHSSNLVIRRRRCPPAVQGTGCSDCRNRARPGIVDGRVDMRSRLGRWESGEFVPKEGRNRHPYCWAGDPRRRDAPTAGALPRSAPDRRPLAGT